MHDSQHTSTLPEAGPRRGQAGDVRPLGEPGLRRPRGDLAALLVGVPARLLDAKGLALVASVHYQEQYDNAFWDGQQMVFGDGDGTYFNDFTISVDVIGHELAHGVTQYTAGLTYVTQSGALNESLSDCFGSMVKQQVLGQDAADADWLIGEGLFTENVNGVALRSMKAPGTAYDDPVVGKDPQPADMDGYVKLPADSQHDNGGVHTNSGIPNRAFYLAATGIGGTSWQGAGLVWYDVVTGSKVTKDIDFAGFAALTVEAAESRFGAGSREAKAVQDAWQTVKVTKAARRTRRRRRRRRRPRRSSGPYELLGATILGTRGPWQHRPGPSRAVNGRRWVLKRRTTPRGSAANRPCGGNGLLRVQAPYQWNLRRQNLGATLDVGGTSQPRHSPGGLAGGRPQPGTGWPARWVTR